MHSDADWTAQARQWQQDLGRQWSQALQSLQPAGAGLPTLLHFGEKDTGIPQSDVEAIRAKRPDVEIHVYPGAQHGFSCDERASYDKASADLAGQRTLAFFAKHLTT